MPTITVQPVTSSSATEAHELISEYYEALQIQLRDSAASTEQYWTSPDSVTLLCRVDSHPAGIVILRPLTDKEVRECKRLYVRPEYRGLGLAGRLMDEAEAWARQRGVKEIWLDSHDGLKAALAFYRKRGYTEMERYNTNLQANVFMKKTL